MNTFRQTVLFGFLKPEKALKNFENCCLINKKIPLFKKDSDIFTHIFWVTESHQHGSRTRRSCTVLASAAKAYFNRL